MQLYEVPLVLLIGYTRMVLALAGIAVPHAKLSTGGCEN